MKTAVLALLLCLTSRHQVSALQQTQGGVKQQIAALSSDSNIECLQFIEGHTPEMFRQMGRLKSLEAYVQWCFRT